MNSVGTWVGGRRLGVVAVVAWVAWLAGGCRTESVQALAERQFRLDPKRPTNAEFDMRLVRVEADGTVVFERAGETLTSKPSNALVMEMRAVKSDPKTQSATMGIFGSWNLQERYFGPFLLSKKYE